LRHLLEGAIAQRRGAGFVGLRQRAPNPLERAVEGVTQKMLIQQLKELEKDGLVRRTVYPQVPPKVEYALTDLGRALAPAIVALLEWAELRQASPSGVPA